VDGVPNWLEPSLLTWVAQCAHDYGTPLARRVEQRLRIELPSSRDEYQIVTYWRNIGGNDRLSLIDCLLYDLEQSHKAANYDRYVDAQDIETRVFLLSQILTDGGSLWRFEAEPHWCLTRRVSETAEAQFAMATRHNSDAASRLKQAWAECYRQNPNYDQAYRNAVLAVEAVVLPITSPRDPAATLGKAIARIRDSQDRWSLAGFKSGDPSGAQTLISMLQLLWKNQERHARNDGTIADVSPAEAEAAVNLAVTIVHWFSANLAKKE
jgi:hypothetical protein